VGGAGGGAQRAAHALLQPGVLEAMELVAAAEARVHRHLLHGVLDGDRPLDDPHERRLEPAQGLAERPVRATGPTGLGAALHLEDILSGIPGHQWVATTRMAVTSALTVAIGSRIYQPKLISWS